MKALLLLWFGIFSSFVTNAAPMRAFVEQSTVSIPTDSESGLSFEDAEKVVQNIEAVYSSLAASRGSELNIRLLWKYEIANATAVRIDPKIYEVRLYGGLIRFPNMDQDTLTAILCHELGHHMAGAPYYHNQYQWSSSEGQADYFAASECLPNVFSKEDNRAWLKKNSLPTPVSERCSKVADIKSERYAICARVMMIGLKEAEITSSLSNLEIIPKIETPDLTVVAETLFDAYPTPQCRLDTFIAGATGAARPACWYKAE